MSCRDLVVQTPDLKRARPPRWAWEGRIVVGYLNLLLGNEGVGKGTLAAWCIARWTRGEMPGDWLGKPARVAVLGDEDSFDHVWTPRLHAAGADLGLVRRVVDPDGGYISLRDDRLAASMEKEGVGVLFLDALLDNLGVTTDDYNAKQVRQALQPARALARELDVAVIGSLHPNKRGEQFRQLVSGSSAFNAVSRSSLLLAEDPHHKGRRVLVRGKGNLSERPSAIQFRIESHSFRANGARFDVPRVTAVEDGGDITAEDLIAAAGQRRHTKVGAVEELVTALLPLDGQWHPARPIIDSCNERGYDDKTITRAAAKLGLEHQRTSKYQGGSMWRWPTAPVGVRDVLSVPSADSSTEDTRDTQDTQDTSDSQGNSSTQDTRDSKAARNPTNKTVVVDFALEDPPRPPKCKKSR